MRKTWIVTLLVVIGMVPDLACSAAEKANASKAPDRDDAVRHVLMALESAITAKSSDNATSLFTDDAQFIDQAGDEIRGRKALHDRFDALFADGAGRGVGIGIHPQNLSFLADTVVLVTGEVSHKHGESSAPASKFSMVMVRPDNRWLIKELTETAIQAAQTQSHLQELAWLIGKWTVEKSGTSVEMIVEWTPEKKFLTSKTLLRRNGKQPETDTQIIGWDPRNSAIVSWHFDSNGGFGNGTWTRPAADKWVVEVVGVGADGSNTAASNVFLPKSSDEFTWQSIHRTLDGAPVADTETLAVHKVKP